MNGEDTASVSPAPRSFGLMGWFMVSLVLHGGLLGTIVAIAPTRQALVQTETPVKRPIEVVLVPDEMIAPSPIPTESPARESSTPLPNSLQRAIAPPSTSTASPQIPPTSKPVPKSKPTTSPTPAPTSNGRSPAPQPSPAPSPQRNQPPKPTPNPTPTSPPRSSPKPAAPAPAAPPQAPASPAVPAPSPKPQPPAPSPVPTPKPVPAPAPAPVSCVQGCGDRRVTVPQKTKSGSVGIRLEIDPSGRVVGASVISSSGDNNLDQRAIASARQMKFNQRDSTTNEIRTVRINLGS